MEKHGLGCENELIRARQHPSITEPCNEPMAQSSSRTIRTLRRGAQQVTGGVGVSSGFRRDASYSASYPVQWITCQTVLWGTKSYSATLHSSETFLPQLFGTLPQLLFRNYSSETILGSSENILRSSETISLLQKLFRDLQKLFRDLQKFCDLQKLFCDFQKLFRDLETIPRSSES